MGIKRKQFRYHFAKSTNILCIYTCPHKICSFFQTWVKIADGVSQDPACSDAFGHIVQTLSQLEDRDTVWKFADWALQRNQEVRFLEKSKIKKNPSLACRGQSCTVCLSCNCCTLPTLIFLRATFHC